MRFPASKNDTFDAIIIGAGVVGDLISTLITVCEDGQNHDTSPVQFHLEHIGHSINLGFFSRNRELHARTSGTVLA